MASIERNRPAGFSIGRFLRFDRNSVWSEDFNAVVNAIDRVHGVGKAIPEIPILHAGNDGMTFKGATDAWFHFNSDANGEIVPGSISVRIGASNRHIKVLHEIGHFLDSCMLSPATFSSVSAIELDDWRVAILRSRLYVELTSIESGLHGQERERLTRARQIDELWARSYAQYVTMRSGDPALRNDIEETRIARIANLRYPLQWVDHDFAVIADTIDALLRRLGWIVRI